MSECCDWHGVCLNDKEEVLVGNTKMIKYVSYCPECNTISECQDGKVVKVDFETKDFYAKKYEEKITHANEHRK